MEKKPVIRFEGYTEEWKQRKFKDIFDLLTNNTLSRAELNDEHGTVQNVHYGDILVKFGEIINVKTDKFRESSKGMQISLSVMCSQEKLQLIRQ